MRLRWAAPAIADLIALRQYIAEHNPQAAQRIAARIRESTDQLTLHPLIGRPGRVAGTRELIVRPYIVAYRAVDAEIEVLRVIHHARDWPSQL
ncbi:MAG: type II toxin-antitoxin system RelE/ParE family toxin [Rhodospirillales bacterium]|nr:type II toxin-antitoxin system RelE/ParE family toxin [Rhodospirillales bacterium]